MSDIQYRIAQALLEIGAVKLSLEEPVTFKSGMRSPVYVDNRTIPYWPGQWQQIISSFRDMIDLKNLSCDIIAGVETGGIPHSAALAFMMQIPSVFVRKQPKGHGLKSKIEGGDVAGKHVLLIEDAITTGSSSLAAIDALREAGAIVDDCMAIFSYGFQEAATAFANADVQLYVLTTFKVIVEQARQTGYFGDDVVSIITNWLDDPHDWTKSE